MNFEETATFGAAQYAESGRSDRRRACSRVPPDRRDTVSTTHTAVLLPSGGAMHRAMSARPPIRQRSPRPKRRSSRSARESSSRSTT